MRLRLSVSLAATTVAQTPKPKGSIRAIELLEQGQPIYYTGSHNGTSGHLRAGQKGRADLGRLHQLRHGGRALRYRRSHCIHAGTGGGQGPTRTGHRTPAVIVNVPVRGTDEATVRANAWMFEQVLATGVHGILLCHATTAGRGAGLCGSRALSQPRAGRRSGRVCRTAGGALTGPQPRPKSGASPRRSIDRKADVWPLNPNGELMLGVKIEDKFGLPMWTKS